MGRAAEVAGHSPLVQVESEKRPENYSVAPKGSINYCVGVYIYKLLRSSLYNPLVAQGTFSPNPIPLFFSGLEGRTAKVAGRSPFRRLDLRPMRETGEDRTVLAQQEAVHVRYIYA